MRGFDFGLLKGRRKIVVNHAILFVPMEPGDILTILDDKTLRALPINLQKQNYRTIIGRNVKENSCGQVTKMNLANQVNLDPRSGFFSSKSGGHFAINCAIAFNARHIYLLGYDGHAPKGDLNFFNTDKIKGKNTSSDSKYQGMNRGFEKFGRWANQITNLCPESYIKTFPKMSLENHFEARDRKTA